ncbi:MAG: hypothetical protein HY331_07750 [Chloroflexi bacterium]|nr:hypothetical protein [Chloroflexota bacterium]
MAQSQPVYLETAARGLLRARAEASRELLGRRRQDERPICRVCPRGCRVARLADECGYCRVGMHLQVGDLVIDAEAGLTRRGLLVRHLVMPGFLDASRQIFRWLAREISPDTYVNVMAQYYPAGAVLETERYPEMRRRLTPDELRQAMAVAREEGLSRFDGRRPRLRAAGGCKCSDG